MRGLAGLIGVLVVALIAMLMYKFYFSNLQSTATGGQTSAQAIDSTSVKNDLLAIAQAERVYQAGHGSYASLGELNSSGSLATAKTSRNGYIYDVETSATEFRATAHCSASVSPGCTGWVIDQTMEVRPAP